MLPLALVLAAVLALPRGEDVAYWTIVRKMALAASIAAARADVQLLQAGRVAEFHALYEIGHKRSYAVVERLGPFIDGEVSGEELDRIEDVSEDVVGGFLIDDIHRRFVPYSGWLDELTFRSRDDWSWGTHVLDIVVRVKAAQYRNAIARAP